MRRFVAAGGVYPNAIIACWTARVCEMKTFVFALGNNAFATFSIAFAARHSTCRAAAVGLAVAVVVAVSVFVARAALSSASSLAVADAFAPAGAGDAPHEPWMFFRLSHTFILATGHGVPVCRGVPVCPGVPMTVWLRPRRWLPGVGDGKCCLAGDWRCCSDCRREARLPDAE